MGLVSRILSPLHRRKPHIAREWVSVAVTYRAESEPLVTTRVGFGLSYADALANADSQLSDGVWRRIVVSNPGSVFTDLLSTRPARFDRATTRRGEDVAINVRNRCVTVLPHV